ncbi:MAG: carboxypeptidase regulatory-like domain-containing protein [Fimbriimonadaceae bacterium]|nr:carboxypeptidase regulatory-like domain-containing protein [Fimbriimonadaceae bacterium]
MRYLQPHELPKRYPISREGLIIAVVGLGLACCVSAAVLRRDVARRTCELSGRLYLDGRPLPGAVLAVDAPGVAKACTDPLGAFRMRRVPVGNVTLTIQRGKLLAGYPLRVPPTRTWELGDVPVYRWRPSSGDPDSRPPARPVQIHGEDP